MARRPNRNTTQKTSTRSAEPTHPSGITLLLPKPDTIRPVALPCLLLLFSFSPHLLFSTPPPVYSPEESRAHFQLAEPGYRVELVASEPMVQDPVMIRFDGEGRLWVVEMRSYMQDIDGKGSHDPIGRISVLTDTDGDGVMDESSVFLDDLVLPRSIAILPDGVLIAENKPLWFVRDTDGDLVADEKHLVDENYAKDNIEHSANGLYRAMDNWFYNAKEGHRHRRVNGDWIREETEARGQWGICQDDRGRLFYNYNHSQLFADFVPPNSFSRNPNHEPTTGWNVSVTMSNEVFPIRPNLATNRGYIPGALDEHNRIRQFTSACAPFIYREKLFPEFAGNAFVCETAGNLVKRNTLTNSGISVTGVPSYSDREFLASKDERFRPCWIETGPDGALYIADMYRGIVQDAPHMSPYLREISLKREMVNPIHLGRIWRIVPDKFSQPKAPAFPDKTTEELVALLDHESGWWRDQGQTHLVENGLSEAIPHLFKTLREGKTELGRLHALWTLEGLGYEGGEKILFALRDTSPLIRSATIRVLPVVGVPAKNVADAIESQIDNSASPEEVLQAVITLGDLKIRAERRHQLLADILISRASDPILRDAALSSLAGQEVAFLSHAWDQLGKEKTDSPGWDFLIESLAVAALKGKDSSDCDQLLAKLENEDAGWREAALRNSILALRNDLIAEPVALTAKPEAVSTFDELAHYFSWPGHTPKPPKLAGVKPLKKNERERFARGRQIYMTSCVACHGTDGKGMKFLAPPLAGSDWVNGSDERLVRVLLHGLSGPITVSGKRYEAPEIQSVMPPLAGLGNSEIAAVLTYIRREWGNTSDPISSGRVSKIRISAQGRTIPWTEGELNKTSHVIIP